MRLVPCQRSGSGTVSKTWPPRHHPQTRKSPKGFTILWFCLENPTISTNLVEKIRSRLCLQPAFWEFVPLPQRTEDRKNNSAQIDQITKMPEGQCSPPGQLVSHRIGAARRIEGRAVSKVRTTLTAADARRPVPGFGFFLRPTTGQTVARIASIPRGLCVFIGAVRVFHGPCEWQA